MPIDNCTHTFDELTASVLPAHFERLKAAMQTPMPASTFVGYKSASREAWHARDAQPISPAATFSSTRTGQSAT
jgi:hypothetical protein